MDFAWIAAHYDEQLFMAVLQNVHLLKQPSETLTPRVLWGLAKFALKKMAFARLPALSSTPSLPAQLRG
jgi:hypothetical protein